MTNIFWQRGITPEDVHGVDEKYSKYIYLKHGVKPNVEVCKQSGDLMVKLEGGTEQQIQQARAAVEDLLASMPTASTAARVCASCGKLDPTYTCSRCYTVCYCTPACQV